MDIRTLLDRVDTIESNQPSIKKYLSESLYNTPEMQPHWKRIDEGFIRGYEKYLSEVALTADQIQNIFKQAGGGEGEAPKDPGKLASLVDKVLPSSQAANLEKSLPEPDAGPVQGFEQKAGAAVQNLQGVDSGTKQSLMQLVKAGVQKPETQQLILAAVGAGLGSLISKVGPILSMIPGGGPVASAITGAVVAGGVAVLAAKLRGEDWKSAFKGAIKPALMGGAAAVVGNLVTTGISSMMSGSSPADAPASTDNPKASSGQGAVNADLNASVGGGMKNPDGSPMTNAQMSAAMDRVAPVAGSAADPNKYYNSLSADQQSATNNSIVAQANQAGGTPHTTADGQVIPPGASQRGNTVYNNSDPADPNVMASIKAKQDYYKNDPAGQAEYAKIMGAGAGRNFEESFYNKQATLKEWLRRDAQGLPTNSVQLYPYVVEGIMDSLKGMFGGKGKEAAPAAGGGVNADALNKAWAAAGSPTDSEEVAKILQGAGVPAETVTKVFTDLKLPAHGTTATPTDAEKPADATAPSDNTGAPAAPAPAASGEPAEMKSDEIVGQLKSFWDKTTANQGSMTSSPQVQQQLIAMAKDAGLATKTFETKRFINK
jgi:hypothetical protein